MSNLKVIHTLSDNLNRLKGFEAGYTTGNKSEMLFSFEGKVYKLSLESLPETSLEMDHIDKYLSE